MEIENIGLFVIITICFVVVFLKQLKIENKIDVLLIPQTNPKRPENLRYWGNEWKGDCPSCHRIVRFASKHCHYCCQLLDWTEVLEQPHEEEE